MPDFGLEITPRPDLPALVARWQREITVPELKAGYFAILDAADAMDCARWLLDLRRRDELTTPELAAWLKADFFPKLPRRYAEPVRIAFLVSPLRAREEQSDSSVAAISHNSQPNQGFFTALFTDEAAAHRWLAG
ncbi:hypothetical protein Q3A66_17850 [Hymenobacter sp. BT770]|uniref:hypothetical protein n=1 Tax=Hymenobacter sp. BT770 TaxID=2886942 RepID=UPI001D114296|nr:hypothetical protein [Hymenobacter sp. BT770]MCC3155046.1 hypothetical protein [Hymenobacter sp. BT770]MDO3416936.1 hypothetical protein [Hymenobacter sp. BT770]